MERGRPWTAEETQRLWTLVPVLRNDWKRYAPHFPGRTLSSVKCKYFNDLARV